MIFDSHIHTAFSADSEMKAEEALAAAEKQVEDDIRATEAEVAPIVNTVEADAQEAYKQYVRNADLLCKQLDALEFLDNRVEAPRVGSRRVVPAINPIGKSTRRHNDGQKESQQESATTAMEHNLPLRTKTIVLGNNYI